MSDKVEVVYIGPKPVKRTTVLGKKFIFPKGKPVAIDAESAYHLLEFPTVFATPDVMEERIEEENKRKAAEEARKQAVAEQQRKEVIQQTFKVYVDGEVKDISKYTTAKLKTVITAEELVVVTENVQLTDMRLAVRDALHEKHGNPEEQGE